MKKWSVYGIISLIISGIIYWGYLCFPNDYIPRCNGTIINLMDEQYISAVAGYDIKGQQMIRNNSDPQLVFANICEQISALEISLSDVTEKVYWVEVYFAEEGEILCEENSIKKQVVSEQNDEIFVEIPKGNYSVLRVDINADFKIDKIIAGSEGAALISTKRFHIGSYLGIVFFCVLFFALFDYQKRRDKITNKKMIIYSLMATGCFILYILLQYVNIHDLFFASDEGDNFMGGIVVASGHDVYSTHTSQHMPIMYYICSIFTLLGAKNVYEYRLCFYILMALMWVAMIFRYRKQFGTFTMIMYPVLYICTTRALGELSTTVLSEQIQAQGMVILVLELLIYIYKKEVDKKSVVCISLGILMSFGTAFMSAFAIFPIVIYVLVTELIGIIQQKTSIREGFTLFVKRDGLLIGGVLLPFVILIGWYAVSGNLYNAFYGAYVVNTKYYSLYNEVGNSFLHSLIEPFKYYFQNIYFPMPFYKGLEIVGLVGVIGLLLYCKKFAGAVTVLLCVIWSGVRGFTSFHSLAYHAMTMILFSIFVVSLYKIVDKLICKYNKVLILSIKSVMILVVLGLVWYNGRDTFQGIDEITIKKEDITHEATTIENHVITQLTEPGDYIYAVSLDCGIYMETMTIPAAPSPVCIWIYEAYRDEIFDRLEENKPKVVVLPDSIAVWGYELREYGPDIYEYVEEHYTKIPIGNLYIRNENIDDYNQIAGQYE